VIGLAVKVALEIYRNGMRLLGGGEAAKVNMSVRDDDARLPATSAKLMGSIRNPAWALRAPSPSGHVGHVFSLRSKEQVRNLNARRVVASMEKADLIRKFAAGEYPGGPVGSDHLPIEKEVAVSTVVFGLDPDETTRGVVPPNATLKPLSRRSAPRLRTAFSKCSGSGSGLLACAVRAEIDLSLVDVRVGDEFIADARHAARKSRLRYSTVSHERVLLDRCVSGEVWGGAYRASLRPDYTTKGVVTGWA
jgi:hypothetical protein